MYLHTTVVDCDVLDTIENGYIEYSDGTVYQSVATYNCHIGYQLTVIESVTRTCRSNGMWNGIAPICNSESKLYSMGMCLTNCITGITPNQLKIDRSLYQLGDRSPILMATSDYLPVIQILKKGNHRQLFRSYLSSSVWYTLYIIWMTVFILSFRHTSEHLWSS